MDALRRVIDLCAEGNSPAPVKVLVYQKVVTHEKLPVEDSHSAIAGKEGDSATMFPDM